MWRAKLRAYGLERLFLEAGVVLNAVWNRLRRTLIRTTVALRLTLPLGLTGLLLIGWALVTALGRGEPDLVDTMREDRYAVGLDLQRGYVLAGRLVLPGIHDRAPHHENAHALLEQLSETFSVWVPPLHIGPETTAVLVAPLAVGDRVIEKDIQAQHLPWWLIPVREAAIFRCVTDIAFPVYRRTHGVSPFQC